MRIRNKTIPFRVTEKELEIIDQKAAKAKLSRTDFLIAAALGKEITLMEDLKPILYELRRIGNNINQLTKLANMLIAHKAGMKQVQMWMGHSSITTTMDTYGHLDDSAKIELGETMTELLRRNKNTEEQANEIGRNHKGAAL